MTANSPPPWLINMQRVGPPPSYPTLKIQGLNAPLPVGAEYGNHPGGWGQCPLDINGNPKYPTSVKTTTESEANEPEPIFEHWGSLASFMNPKYSSSSSSEEEPNMEVEPSIIPNQLSRIEPQKPPKTSNLILEEIRSEPAFLESGVTPTSMDSLLRKRKKLKHGQLGQLYRVLEQEPSTVTESDLFGSAYTYKMPMSSVLEPGVVDLMKSQHTAPVELTIDPSELAELGEHQLMEKFEKIIEKDKEGKHSEVVESKRQAKKRKREAEKQMTTPPPKKVKKPKDNFEKGFKF